jgi:Fic family protein
VEADDQPAGRYTVLPPPYRPARAFIPSRLPPKIEYSRDIAELLSRADKALGRVSGTVALLPNPRLLARPMLTLEAVSSTRIEGTETGPEEAFRAQVIKGRHMSREDREVTNVVDALAAGVDRIRDQQGVLDLDLVRAVHATVLRDVRGADAAPGRFRERQVWIGPGPDIREADYVAPPWKEVEPLMADWAAYAGACISGDPRAAAPSLIQCALLHAQFEMIHPFSDGNGRTGRVLMALFLVAKGDVPEPVLGLSAYLERYRPLYYAALRAISREGDWPRWLTLFLGAVEEQSARCQAAARALLAWRDEWRAKLQERGSPANLLALLDRLVENPVTTSTRVREQLGVSAPTALRLIGELESLGLLEETTGKRRDREYTSTALLELVDRIVRGASDVDLR